MHLIAICLMLGSLGVVHGYTDICYGELGCFTDRPPFSSTLQRPIGFIPEPPEKVGVKFSLFTRQVSSQPISYSNISSHYNPELKSKFIVHGFLQHGKKQWVTDMKDAMLRVEDVNVVVVDWSRGNGFPYTQASANAQVAGSEIARLIRTMVETKGARLADFHLIGHSLGCHVAGYAGERLKGIGRITGLDPAGPGFEFTDPAVRLDPKDAEFVDIIHTDGAGTIQLGLGLLEAAGHVDFYPNGGKDQPSCAQTSDKLLTGIFNLVTLDIDSLEDVSGCSHVAAYKFFIDSIESRECKYYAYPCASQEQFDQGSCLKCSNGQCNQMGYWASPLRERGPLYLSTQNASSLPFCNHHYQVKLASSSLSSQGQTRGKILIQLSNGYQTTIAQRIEDSQVTLKPGSTLVRLLGVGAQIESPVTTATVTFSRTNNIFSSWLYDSSWSFKYLEILDAESQTVVKLCPSKSVMNSNESVLFSKCVPTKKLKISS